MNDVIVLRAIFCVILFSTVCVTQFVCVKKSKAVTSFVEHQSAGKRLAPTNVFGCPHQPSLRQHASRLWELGDSLDWHERQD